MFYTGIAYGTPTSAFIQQLLDDHLSKTVKPEQLTYFVTEAEELRGQLAALTEIEKEFADIETAAADLGWTADHTLVRKLQAVLRLAAAVGGKSLQFSDDKSGRGNDNVRSYRDGWFNIIELVSRDLDREISAAYDTVDA